MDTCSELLSVKLLCFMGERGIRYLKDDKYKAVEYVERMIAGKRVIQINDTDGIHTVLFFSVCHDSDKFLKKGMWEYCPHDPDGEIFYVEKIVSKEWSKNLTMIIHDVACKNYPQLKLGKWHRYGIVGDREFKLRRRNHVEHTD